MAGTKKAWVTPYPFKVSARNRPPVILGMSNTSQEFSLYLEGIVAPV
jgi:hypothetical protein